MYEYSCHWKKELPRLPIPFHLQPQESLTLIYANPTTVTIFDGYHS